MNRTHFETENQSTRVVLDRMVWHRGLIVAVWHPWMVAGRPAEEIERVASNGLTLVVVSEESELA